MGRDVAKALNDALKMMRDAGFEIDQRIQIAVDEKLSFMGYTSQQWQRHLIVVSGSAVKSGMLEGLLIHELSHVYRNATHHPSHDPKIIANLTYSFGNLHELNASYQKQMLHQIVNHVQDLYADDIAIKVFTANKQTLLTSKQLSEFFLGWIREEPPKSSSSRRDRWINAAVMLNNCFAISNMQRHKIEYHGDRAKSRNERFFSRINPAAARMFPYFIDFMINLREDVEREEFQNQMSEYLERFLVLVENI